MRKSRLREDNPESDVDMTPMLDIVFILLIFFIVTTSFVREEGIVINRPKAQNNPPSDPPPIVLVRIDEAGKIRFNGNLVDKERLSARIESYLAENTTNSAVVIPHKDATHEMVVAAIDQIRSFDQLTISIGK